MPTEHWRGPRRAGVIGPSVLAFVQVVGTFGAGHAQPDRRAVDAVAVLLALAGPLVLLLWRRLGPLSPWLVAGVTIAYLARAYPYGPVFVSLAVALVVSVISGHRATAWLVAAAVLVAHFAIVATREGQRWSWPAALGVGAWTLLVLAAAELVRVRRDQAIARRAARVERARHQAGEERLLIAQELHDVIAHHLSLINVQAGVALHLVDRKPEQTEPALVAIKDASKEALAGLRSLVDLLRDEQQAAPRAPTARLSSIDDLVERAGHAGLTMHKSVAGGERTLPDAVEIAAVRIVQEAVTNVIRHAHARRADVHLGYGADVFTVAVDDDGRGVPGDLAEGNGLRGMRERAHALGGELRVAASKLGGLRVEATLPLGYRS